MRTVAIATTALLAAALSAAAFAQTPNPQAVHAARAATAKAQAVTFNISARNGSAMSGSIALYQIGHTRTRVVVTIPKASNERLSLYKASDCYDSVTRARTLVALTPINQAGNNAQSSSTIVNLPLNELESGNYVVDVRDATGRATYAEACGHLGAGH
ncbi:MAG TPA: hypothetical protein VMD91_17300 [Candidatus Sulfotelmatobacter sp.]|nr:hypothetical protein [Candidatus Sulfotelmatobacter sp.]